jgi:phosphatidylethanolamine/phosphatidyl-N-methylethanolamine N-methyltransferase
MSSLAQPLPPGKTRRRQRRARNRARDQRVSAAPRLRRCSRFMEGFRFFCSFVRRPSVVGSLLPSSEALARAMLAGCDLRQARTVVELGPGTGALTRPILGGIGPQTLFLALELDENHVRNLRQRFPRLRVFRNSAEQLCRYLGRFQRHQAEVVISGLPWANLPTAPQERLFKSVLRGVSPDGVFVTFAYVHAWWMPGATRFRRLLRRHFQEVIRSRIVWRNLPPAYVFYCRRPNL